MIAQMSPGELGALCLVIGSALCFIAWGFFRLEEYRFFTVVPFAYAHRYMRQPGGILWWCGIVIVCVGIFNTWSGSAAA